MVCCAFAVFILGQLYMAAEAVMCALGITPSSRSGPSAADWNPIAEREDRPQLAAVKRLPSRTVRLLAAGTVCAAALATAYAFRPNLASADLAAALADPMKICGTLLPHGH